MLHLITEVGKPGYDERERKHFPHLTNRESELYRTRPRGRRYIPHGYGDDYHYRPHNQNINIEYSECGPDWKSRLRWIPSPHSKDYPAAENWPTPYKPIRTYNYGVGGKTEEEWNLFPEGYSSTLRSTWDGIHKATQRTEQEITQKDLFGKNRIVYPLGIAPWSWHRKNYTGNHVTDKRNNIPMAAPGDKSYQAVEYSPEFHKKGSTLPIINFGGSALYKEAGVLQFTDLPPAQRENFLIKERRRKRDEEIDTVKSLEKWRPATPLLAPPNHGQPPIPEKSELGAAK